MGIEYHLYKSLNKLLSPIPEKLLRSIKRFVAKELTPYRKHLAKKNTSKRAKYKLNNFLALAEDIPKLVTSEVYAHNDFYFNASTLKKFAGIDKDDYIRAAMEHAPYIPDDYFWQCDVEAPFNSIIVNSPYRKEVLSKVCDKNILVVGPYIAYAENILSEAEIQREKKRLGKNQ